MRRRLASAALSAMPRAYNSSRPMHTCQCILPRRWAPVRPALGAARAAHAHSSHLARVCRCPKPTRACSRAPASMDPARPMHMAAQSPKYPFLHSSNKGLSPTSHLKEPHPEARQTPLFSPLGHPKPNLRTTTTNSYYNNNLQPSAHALSYPLPNDLHTTASRPPLDHLSTTSRPSLDISRSKPNTLTTIDAAVMRLRRETRVTQKICKNVCNRWKFLGTLGPIVHHVTARDPVASLR